MINYGNNLVEQDSLDASMGSQKRSHKRSHEGSHTRSHKSLFEQYYVRLCDFARRILNDEDLAEDVVQDVFVAFIERSETVYIENEVIRSYLYQSVKNACLNKLRKGKVVEQFESNHNLPVIDEEHALSAMIHSEIVGEIHYALKKLPEGCRLIIRLGYFEGLNNPQIANELKISVNTVKSQKQRALFLLRKELVPGT
ncbi:RNA polymerase sigma-70 factor [Pedobacter metabolipauper]|uniref:RNA polymerase sigma-70 factor (ECF subfamily) n=1 Tax=Pedobacter metabolipauper TaxID=425513 RepID=A0A4R6T1J2_9SPHI|nr:RNA polymerase sigma-70 factor [Pedobacter metabolipauper]TDQ11508.1 RNA polymerase sigma-70 factor (ECF subfamily) [Pedobacter metabolipauper]